jgi:TPR repeat protein
MAFDGNGVPKKEDFATDKFRQGCNAGEMSGCLKLSLAYGTGRGVPKDLDQSYTLADGACTAGVAAGCIQTALDKIAGQGVPKDVKAGIAQLDGTCARKDGVVACQSLVGLYKAGLGADIPADPGRSREYESKACDHGAMDSCARVRHNKELETVDADGLRANAKFQAECDKGDPVGCSLLGEDLIVGRGIPMDRERGAALLKKTCASGGARACQKIVELGVQ